MRRLILVAMIAGLLAPTGLHAQKVYVEDGKVILDLTEEAGMPAGAITSDSKTEIYNNEGTFEPQNKQWGIVGGDYTTADNESTGIINATVYQKLEVSPTEPDETCTWAEGFQYCLSQGSDWRLPTQRELMLMYIFKTALNEVIGTDLGRTQFSSANYWSATEYNDSRSWYVTFINGTTNITISKTSPTHRVRCVREL